MKTSIRLIIIIIFMHTMTLINVTMFNGDWNGIVLALSSMLFMVAITIFGIAYQKKKRV